MINFNCKLSDDETLNNFINKIVLKYGQYIKYNIGPNGIQYVETSNTFMLKKLVEENVSSNDDFIMPADSDEFHKFDTNKTQTYSTFNDIVNFMNEQNVDYITGCTNERIMSDGSVNSVLPNINIFDQFPDINNKLFCMPKISIIRAKYYNCLGVGHHYIDGKLIEQHKLKSLGASKTNHFKWTLEGKQRM